MPANPAELGFETLSVQERLDLIERIWDTLPVRVDPGEVPAWHRQELTARRAEADRNPGTGRPWREVLSRLGYRK